QVDQRAADDQAKHPSKFHVELVGGPGSVAAQIFELPTALDRLELALLLGPTQGARPVVGEAHGGLDAPYLGIGFCLDSDRSALVVAVEGMHPLEAALPLGCAFDILAQRPDLVDGCVNLRG